MRAERFTAEERELLAVPLKVVPAHRHLLERWLEESGGLDGRGLGLYAAGALVNPQHCTRTAGALGLPGGWQVAGELGEVAPLPPLFDPLIPDTDVRASEVLCLNAEGNKSPSWWVTDRGVIAGPRWVSGKKLAAMHPDLRAAGKNWHVNARRIRRLRGGAVLPVLEFDDGQRLELRAVSGRALQRNVGLPGGYLVGGETPAQLDMRRLGMRRWPLRLETAPEEMLKSEFGESPEALVEKESLLEYGLALHQVLEVFGEVSRGV